jgi:hypothetical protein
MKKLLVVVSVLTLSLAAVGCNKKEEGAAGEAAKTAEPAKTEPATPPPATPPAAEPAKTEPAAPAAGGAAASTGVPECDEYVAAIEKFTTCDKVPQAARDAQKQSLDAMKQGWASLSDPAVPAEAKKAAADGCKTAVDALKQAATASGCTL